MGVLMKYLVVLLFCIGFIQGCSSNQKGHNRDGFQDSINPRAEFGSRCVVHWDPNVDGGSGNGSCGVQQDLVGTHCVCNTSHGIKNGSIR